MARFFWFSIEFGLMSGTNGRGYKVYGSGLLSSHGEIVHAIDSPSVQRYPFQLEWVVNQSFEIDRHQPLLFSSNRSSICSSWSASSKQWMRAGKLDNVAPGEPEMSEADVKSFLDASAAAA